MMSILIKKLHIPPQGCGKHIMIYNDGKVEQYANNNLIATYNDAASEYDDIKLKNQNESTWTPIIPDDSKTWPNYFELVYATYEDRVYILQLDCGGWWMEYDESFFCDLKDITAWSPIILPAPYKPET